MLLFGFLFTRITKLLKLPNVTAYIVAGIVIGPYCLNLIPTEVIDGLDFISDIALAFIAFSVGEYFRLSTLKKNGKKVVIITLFEALLASVLVFILTYFILKLGFAFSVILAALASATAPASTMMTIRQTKAHGDFVDTLLSVVALDDVVSLVAFSVSLSVAIASLGGNFSAGDILLPIVYNILLVGIGIGCGFLLKFLMKRRSTDNRLIVSICLLFALCGIGAALDVSPLLACMAMGMVYINITDDERLFKQLNYFSPPILLIFFVRSGLTFRLDVLFDFNTTVGSSPLLLIGVLYFIVRIVGKYAGAFLGCWICKKPKEVRNYLGLALIPQAGVSIGLAALGARMLGGEMGSLLQTIILSSSILYELIGPACAKLALFLSKSYGVEQEEKVEPPPTEVETLQEKLLQIQNEIEKKQYVRTEEEAAFLDAAEEEDDSFSDYNKRKFKNRR
jgi:Kef-type K+ transport system membrane component KefB